MLTGTMTHDGWEKEKPRKWEHEETEAFSYACPDDPVGIYRVTEVVKKRRQRRPPLIRYCAEVLTEVGLRTFDNKFHTLHGAKRFCERHYRDWQKKQPDVTARKK